MKSGKADWDHKDDQLRRIDQREFNKAKREWIEERAALMEYDGGLPRVVAEHAAKECADKVFGVE